MKLQDVKIVVRGGGDLASGVVYRLKRAGFSVMITELPEPLVVRRTVSYAEAVYEGRWELEGLVAIRTERVGEAMELAAEGGVIPVFIDPKGEIVRLWHPRVVVDAVIAKRNILKTTMQDASLVIALGPGFRAGVDVHAVIETNRGHSLGRVIYDGEAEPNTGVPGLVNGSGRERVIYSPVEGIFRSERRISDSIAAGELFGWVDDTPIYVEIGGCIRGLLRSGVHITSGVKVGDIDPRCEIGHCYMISDKALAIGGGVLEAVLTYLRESGEYTGSAS